MKLDKGRTLIYEYLKVVCADGGAAAVEIKRY